MNDLKHSKGRNKMTSIIAFLTTHIQDVTLVLSAFSTVLHWFPTKTAANKIGDIVQQRIIPVVKDTYNQ